MSQTPSTGDFVDRLAKLHAAATPGRWRRGWPDGSGPRYILAKPKGKPPEVVVAGGEDSWSIPEGVLRQADAALIIYLHTHARAILAVLPFLAHRVGCGLDEEGNSPTRSADDHCTCGLDVALKALNRG